MRSQNVRCCKSEAGSDFVEVKNEPKQKMIKD